MSSPKRFQLCLIPMSEDDAISDLPSAGSNPASQASPAEPLDVIGARVVLLSEADGLEALGERLGHLHRLVPVTERQDAMYGGQIPLDVAANMAGAIDFALREYVRPALVCLRAAATVTAEELGRQFESQALVTGDHEGGATGAEAGS